jgi:predicted DNA-binding transcriptional regulator YafY
MKKSDREIMEILEAFDATGCAHSAAELAGVDPKTVRRYVDARDAGRPVDGGVTRPKLIDAFMGKIEEWVERSEGKVRADVIMSGCCRWGSLVMSARRGGRSRW